jgi:hypothetical protein
VATVSDAHNQATAGVNIVGSGDGVTAACPGGGAPGTFVFAGIAWTADSGLPGSPIKMDYYKASPGVSACIFQTQELGLPAPLTVATGGRVLFVRNSTGGLNVCPVNLATNVVPSFQNGACASGSLALTLSDTDGHTSQVTIDPSGLARRQN